jgi:glucose/arabinose dehydrogenase
MRRLVSSILVVSLAALGASAARGQGPAIAIEAVVTSGVRQPLLVTHAGDGSGRLFVIEQPGLIRVIQDGALRPEPFLNITARVQSGGERGLLGLAFHPAYRSNGRYYVNYTRVPDGGTIVAEYTVSQNPNVSQQRERVLLFVPQPYPNHNGGMIAFGPDGFLYVGLGDGGSAGDPQNRAQNPGELLGKMLRIDVNRSDRGLPYAIPADNPHAAGGGRPEIFASGLRNPWRFSFDRRTGELWAADVGQHSWEEIDIVRRGGNYGWRIMEGNHCFNPPQGCPTAGLVPPVAEYATGKDGRCSITGGYVYRGARIPSLVGTYVYGDYCSGEIFGLSGGRAQLLVSSRLRITSFGEDEAGELYVAGHNGTIHRLVAR